MSPGFLNTPVEGKAATAGIITNLINGTGVKKADVNLSRIQNDYNPFAVTPLYIAADYGLSTVVSQLIDAGAKEIAAGGRTPLLVALANFKKFADMGKDTTDLIKILISAKNKYTPNLNAVSNGDTPLLLAIAIGKLDLVNALITGGATTGLLPKASHTPLQKAVEVGSLEIVNALIAAEVDVNAVVTDTGGDTPLQIACAEGKIDIINALLAANATTDIPDNAGQTPMSVANIAGKVDVIGLLVTAGANVNTVVDNEENNMPQLQYASVKGDINTVNAILAGSPDLNAVDELTGSTALIAASKAGKTDAVKALIAAGADVSLANGDGETALSLAQKPEIKAALTTAGAVGGRRRGKSRKSKSRKAKGRKTRGKGRKA